MPKKSKIFKGHKVEFDNDTDPKVMKVKHNDHDEGEAGKGEVDVSPLDPATFEGKIVATSSNPTCFWYRYNGQWYWYCC